jgi:hypothetical protein
MRDVEQIQFQNAGFFSDNVSWAAHGVEYREGMRPFLPHDGHCISHDVRTWVFSTGFGASPRWIEDGISFAMGGIEVPNPGQSAPWDA